MAHTKTIDTYYKDVKVVLDLATGKFSVNHEDLTGEYASMGEAEKAIREWLKPEVAEATPDVVNVLVIRHGYRNDGAFYEGTTRFAEHARRWGTRIEYWVTKKKTEGAYDKKKMAVESSEIFFDTPENREILAKLKENQKEWDAADASFRDKAGELKKKLTNAKPKK